VTARLHSLSNGVRVVFDPMPGLETLALTVVAGRGARYEDEARSGWSHLLEHMVFKGAGDRTARAIVEDIEAAGGQLNAATGYERTSFQTRTLAGGLPLAMQITADLVLRPTLDAGDLVREKQVVGQEIAEAADTPDDLVFELAQEQAFAGQSLGRPILGTVKSLRSATPAALSDWRAALYAPDRLVISVAGKVDEEDLLRWRRTRSAILRRPPARPCRHAPGLHRRVGDEAAQAGAGARGAAAAGCRRVRSRLFRPAPVRRGARRRDVVAAVPGSPREARPRLRHRRLCRHLRRRRHAGRLRRLRRGRRR
jgi:predicted Zn-dependent peptidase